MAHERVDLINTVPLKRNSTWCSFQLSRTGSWFLRDVWLEISTLCRLFAGPQMQFGPMRHALPLREGRLSG